MLDSGVGERSIDALSRMVGLNRRSGEKDRHLSDIIVTETDAQLNVEFFSKGMLKWLARLAKDASTLSSLLIERMRIGYLDTALDAAQDTAGQQSTGESELSYLLEIKPATIIMHLMFTFINAALGPLSQPSLTVRREMVKLRNTTLASLEQKINTIIQRSINGLHVEGNYTQLEGIPACCLKEMFVEVWSKISDMHKEVLKLTVLLAYGTVDMDWD
ncbi:Exocyst complex component 5 [Rhizina undulata]